MTVKVTIPGNLQMLQLHHLRMIVVFQRMHRICLNEEEIFNAGKHLTMKYQVS